MKDRGVLKKEENNVFDAKEIDVSRTSTDV